MRIDLYFSILGLVVRIIATTTQTTENTGDSDADTEESDTQSSEQVDAGTSSTEESETGFTTEESKDETASEKKDEESVGDGGNKEQSSESTTTASTDESATTAGTDESAASEGATESEDDTTYISGTQTASVGNATVKVTYDETAQIPEGAELVVSTSDNADALEAKTEELFSGFTISNSTCLDIHFENEDGEEIEPEGDVDVSITLSNQAVLEEGQEVSALHFKDDGSVEIVDKDVQDVASANIATKGLNALKKAFGVGTVKTNREISFTTDSFSDWVVTYVDTSGNSSTISTAMNYSYFYTYGTVTLGTAASGTYYYLYSDSSNLTSAFSDIGSQVNTNVGGGSTYSNVSVRCFWMI